MTRPSANLSPEARRALEETVRFAVRSGAWLVPGGAAAPAPEAAPAEARTLAKAAGVAAPSDARRPREGGTLAAVREELGDCRRCRLSEGRTRLVFGVGDPAARLLLVGEGPGAEEDRRGEPFVGRAGQLLDRMLRALGLGRGQVYIANVVKCRPPGNREPAPDEAAACLPFLWRQIEAVGPRVICALGAHAARNLLGAEGPLGELRGRPQRAGGWTVLPTYHPAYLLRNPAAKRLAWDDLKKVRDLLSA